MEQRLIRSVKILIWCTWVVLLLMCCSFWLITKPWPAVAALKGETNSSPSKKDANFWKAPDESSIPSDQTGALIRYGRELVSHTALFLGPNGKIASQSNGMNCQNCHLKAGTVPFGNNYSAVASTYPKFRDRSGTYESIEKRVNDCLERSLNGKPLDSASREMRAFVAYIKWLGKDVVPGSRPQGAGLWQLKGLNRAADPVRGKTVFIETCARCHGSEGQGLRVNNSVEWKYPPLWGEQSYNTGAGLFRLSPFAGYVKMNMPNDHATFENPALTDEEAWDVAAFVNSMPRPQKDVSRDWPQASKKPFDYPFGPYADSFSERQHKFGPFYPILAAKQKSK